MAKEIYIDCAAVLGSTPRLCDRHPTATAFYVFEERKAPLMRA